MNSLGIGEAGGVLEIGYQVYELGIGVFLHSLFQLIAVDTVAVHGNSKHLGAVHMEGLKSHQVRGVLHDYFVTRIYHGCANHGQSLLGTVGNNNIICLDSIYSHGLVALCHPLSQGRITGSRAVLEGNGTLFLKDLLCGGFHLLYGEGYRVGQSAGKGYYIRGGCSGQDAVGELALEIRSGDDG